MAFHNPFPIAFFLALLALTPAAAADLTFGAGTDWVSRYVSRGVAGGDGAALQTGAWLSGRGLTLTVWNNLPLARADGRGKVDEWDTTLAWERPWRDARLELAATLYSYPDQPDVPDTSEISLQLTRPLGDYEVYALGVADVEAWSGAWMAEVGGTRAWEIAPRLGVEATASLLWGNRRFHEANSGALARGVGVIGAAVSLPYDLGGGLTLRPHLEVHLLPHHRIREALEEDRYVTFGVALETE